MNAAATRMPCWKALAKSPWLAATRAKNTEPTAAMPTAAPIRWPTCSSPPAVPARCTGTSDTIDGVTADAVSLEVLEVGTVEVAGSQVAAVKVRTTDTFTDAQRGTEVDEWWVDATTGLPLHLAIDSKITSDTPVGTADYTEHGTLELTTLQPAT